MKLGDDNDAEEFNKVFRRTYVLSWLILCWLNGDRVYHEGVCYVFPHGKQHIVKILKKFFSDLDEMEGQSE
jgi:hypothetical protein